MWTLASFGFVAVVQISTLQARVGTLQQDVLDLSDALDQHMMVLHGLLEQKASVQNVSRLDTVTVQLQQELSGFSVEQRAGAQNMSSLEMETTRLQQKVFNLSRDFGQKADTANLTVLQSDLAWKASTQSVVQLQEQVVRNFSRLESVVRGKASMGDVASKANETTVDAIAAQLAAAEAQLRQKADKASTPKFADLPVTPNLMQDTKHFQGICHGKVGVATSWSDSCRPPWTFYNTNGTAVDVAHSTAEVVDMTSQASAERAGLWPLGALDFSQGGLLRDTFDGADLRALLLTVETLPAADNGAFGVLSQGCPTYTSWSVGAFTTEVSVYVKVLEYTGNIVFEFLCNVGACVLIKGPAGRGWQHVHHSRAGWGGCQMSFIRGAGRMRVAIALPYQSFGNHSGVPVWAGFEPHFYLGNV